MPSIFIWDSIFMGSGARLRPCLTNAEFWQGLYSTDFLFINDKSGLDNHALLSSNCIEMNGISSIQIINSVLVSDIDALSINYSIDDGANWENWSTGDSIVTGLFEIIGNTLTVGFDGVVFLKCIIGNVSALNILAEPIFSFNNSDGIYNKSYDTINDIVSINTDCIIVKKNEVFNNVVGCDKYESGTTATYTHSTGQSNSIVLGLTSLKARYDNPARAKTLVGGVFVPLSFNNSDGHSIEYSLSKLYKGDTYYSKFGVGSTSITLWQKGGTYYNNSLAFVQASLLELPVGSRKVYNWNQWEADCQDLTSVNAYKALWLQHMTDFESDMGEQFDVIIMIRPTTASGRAFAAELTDVFDDIATNTIFSDRIKLINIDDVRYQLDLIHYSSFYTDEILSKKYLEVLTGINQLPVGYGYEFVNDSEVNLNNTIGDYVDNFTIYCSGNFGSQQQIFRKAFAGNLYQYHLFLNAAGAIYFQWTDQALSSHLENTVKVYNGRNANIAIVVNGVNSFIYVDGEVEVNFDGTGLYNHGVSDLVIGRLGIAATSEHYHQGLSNTAMTVDELDDLFIDNDRTKSINHFNFDNFNNAILTDIVNDVDYNIIGSGDYITQHVYNKELINSGQNIYIPLRPNGTPVLSLVENYEKASEWRYNAKIFPDLDAKLTIPIYGALTFDEIVNHADVGSKIFYEEVRDLGVLVGIKELFILSAVQTGKCLEQTLRYFSLWALMLNLLIQENTINYLTLL